MAEEQKPKKPRAKKYDKKVAVKGSFMDIMKAAVVHADKNVKKGKE